MFLKWFYRISAFLVFILLLILVRFGWAIRDRHPDADMNVHIETEEDFLQAGFASVDITPQVPDTWIDKNEDAQYDPKDGDTFTDGNGNGKFDPVWMAGFQNNRPAMGVHDPLWARTMIIANGEHKIALTVIDAIGFGADDIITVKKMVPTKLNIDYVVIMSTHSHETPDLVGLWGKSPFSSGVDNAYKKQVQEGILQSINQAHRHLRPAIFRVGHDLTGAANLVEDSREPIVMDPRINILQAIDAEMDTTLGVFFNWSNHPETLWNKNLYLTSDFPYYVREALEKGLKKGDSTLIKGLGGTAIFSIGAIGGLMTTRPDFPIPGFKEDTVYLEASFDKAAAQGYQLAALGIQCLEKGADNVTFSKAKLKINAKTLELPLKNPLYRLAAFMGVVQRGTSSWINIRTEIAAWQLGDVHFLHYPGELYPEILNGGVEKPKGQDYNMAPFETPPLRSYISSKYSFTMGLSNDMIGYLVPKSQWDEKPPFTYTFKDAPYGEINSLGPETAPILYKAMKEILKK
jgi:hypothetical protein